MNEMRETDSNGEADLDGLIEEQRWDLVHERFKASPDTAKTMFNSSLGWTKLHWLSSMGSTPSTLLDLVASLYPEAIFMPDNRYGDTPLHITCRNSQTSAEKVKILLGYVTNSGKDGVLIRNRFGGTALHSASNHNAVLEVLQLLVDANPKILRVTTHDGIHAISALYHAYIHTIPGYMCIARTLEGEIVSDGHFERFWNKVEFLATEYFFHRKSTAGPQEIDNDNSQHRSLFILHGLIHCSVDINLFKVALKKNASFALAADSSGNLPLHLLLENRPFRLKEREAIQATIEAASVAAARPNNAGDVPLMIAIHNKIPWENGVQDIVKADTTVISRRHQCTGLFPFQLAAVVGGRFAIDTTFHLICTRPDLVALY